jgi:hypothetical protein
MLLAYELGVIPMGLKALAVRECGMPMLGYREVLGDAQERHARAYLQRLWELEHTCALDVADKGGITLEEVGAIMNLTRERVRQVETRGIHSMRVLTDDDIDRGLDDDLD